MFQENINPIEKNKSKTIVILALIGNGLIALCKFSAAWFTKSSAMYAEGIHSTIDTTNQLLLLYGFKRANKPATQAFPYGYGKEVYFWSFIVAALLFLLGSGLSIREGIHHLYQPRTISNFFVNYIVIAFSFLFEGIAWFFAVKEFYRRKGDRNILKGLSDSKDASLLVVLFEDSAAMLGLLIAVIGISLSQILNNPIYDAMSSIAIGIILGFTAIWLAYETKGLLIGESANKEIVQGINNILKDFKEIDNINEVLTMHMGPDYILVNLSIDFYNHLSSGQLEIIIEQIDKKIKIKYPIVQRIFIEAEDKKKVNNKQ